MRFIVAIAALMMLSSCASQIMQSYVGKDVNEAILDYGPPVNVMDMEDGKKAYQWNKRHGGGSGFANTYSNTTTFYSSSGHDCTYTLIAEKQDTKWIVTSFRKPPYVCE